MAYPAVAVAQTPIKISPTEMPKDDFKREKFVSPQAFDKGWGCKHINSYHKRVVAKDHVSTQYMVFFRRATLAPSGELLIDKLINN